jgi:hypothetical protein
MILSICLVALLPRGPAADDAPRLAAEGGRAQWAFRPLGGAAPPATRDASWCRNPIDAFVLARLDAEGLKPNPEADRRRLLRRAYLGITGLPPEPFETDSFLADPDPAAYEALVDRLLASPRLGERFARHWLDVARFAESHGFEHDYDREHAYHYRDFVIRAFNDDMPYDRFTRWQLAGDEIAPDDPLALMATGFLGAGVFPTQITKNEVERTRYDALDDMLSTTSMAMLGVTVGCARCHDHKFDPFSAEEYYRLLSTFTTTVRSEVDLDLDPEANRAALAAYEREHAPLAEELARYEREVLPAAFEAWLESDAAIETAVWTVLDCHEARSEGGASLTRLDDGSYLAGGKNPDHDDYVFKSRLDGRPAGDAYRALRLEALAHPSMVKGGPGRAANGNFGLSSIRVTAAALGAGGAAGEARELALTRPRASFEQTGLPAAAALDGKASPCWAVDPRFGEDHAAVFKFAEPLESPNGVELTVRLVFQCNAQHAIGRPRLALTASGGEAPLAAPAMPAAAAAAAARLRALRVEGKGSEALPASAIAALADRHRAQDPGWLERRSRVDAHLKTRPQPRLTRVLVASEGLQPMRHHTQGADFFDATYILQRGDPNLKAGLAAQGFPAVLMRAPEGERRWLEPPPPGWRTSYRRRSLANWITDAGAGAGHLLARVIVNRIWQQHFGRGLVGTPNDFGLLGETPSHPELLDWLAAELLRQRWSLKAIHRLVLTSAAFRQGVETDAARSKVDPENRLLWRRTPKRLEAEAIRDCLLAACGELDGAMYGPGTLDEASRRRSIYLRVKRSQLLPMMQLFDAPEPLGSQGSRPSTTVAPQALVFMNAPHVRSWSKALARRLEPIAREDRAAAVAAAFRRTLAREPDPEEGRDILGFLDGQIASYREAGHEAPLALALADLCQALLGLNEFVFID